ncbi:MAG: rRNA maturation RNase YbeY [Bryobacteraceae bacterium]
MPTGDTFVVCSVVFRVSARDIARRAFRRFARKLQTEVAHGKPFECLVTSDDELRRLNREFRGKDYATDVLSFPSARFPSTEAHLGEIAISYDRTREQARDLAHSAEQELQVLMLHGLLHLIGLDHERDDGQMAIAEGRWRKHFNLPSGLIERVQA